MPQSTVARVLLAVVGVIVIATGAVLLYLTFGDLSRFQPRIEAAVSDALGREFRIGGNLEIEALPHPSLVAENMSLANASWGSPQAMLEVGKLIVEVDLWSLISGPIIVERLELSDATLLIEEDQQGRSNLAFGGTGDAAEEPEPAEAEAGSGLPIVFEHVSVSSFELVSRQPGNDDVTASVDMLDATTTAEGVLAAVMDGRFQDYAIDLDVRLDPASSLQSGDAVAYEIAAAIDGAAFTVSGDLDSLFASAPDAEDGEIRQHVRFDGSVESISALGTAFDMTELPDLALSVAGELELGAGGVSVDPLSVMLGDSDFAGAVSVDFGDIVAVELNGASSLMDLRPFFPPTEPESGDASGDEAAAASEESETESDADGGAGNGALVFSDEPLPVGQLASLNLSSNITITDFRFGDLELRDFEISVTSGDGLSQLESAFRGTGEGMATTSLQLDTTSPEAAVLDLDLEIEGARLNLASGDLEDTEQIPPIDVTVDVNATGPSPHALASSANGRASVVFREGLIENSAVGIVSGDILAQLFSALNPMAEEEEFSTLECVVVGVDITDGLASLDPILVQTEKLQIVGGGEIELDTESLNIEFNTKPRSGVGITADMFVTPFVRLTGTLAEPGVGLNARGALLQGGAAVLTGGATLLLGGLADRASAQGDECAAALATVGETGP